MNRFTRLFKTTVISNTVVKRITPVFFIFLVTLVFYYPVILQNKDPLPTDALVGAHVPWIRLKWEKYPAGVPIKNQEITDSISQFYLWKNLAGDFLRNGQLPLWNRYMFSGYPLLASLHSAAIYPINIIYLFFSDITAWRILIFLQVFLSGAFMYLFLKYILKDTLASLFGAFSFMFCGYMVAWLEFATGGHAGLWLPLLMYLLIRMLDNKSFLWFIAVPLVFFMIFTAGDFQIPVYITLVYFTFGIYYIYSKLEKDRLKSIARLFTSFLIGICISAIQLIPSLELFLNSIRTNDLYISEYNYGLMSWKKIVLFIWPDFFGNVVTRNYWAEYGFHEYISYVGILVLLMATFSFFIKGNYLPKYFKGAVLFSLMLLLPTPLGYLPYKLNIPALSTSSASRIIFLVDFCLIILASYGLSQIKSNLKRYFKIVVIFIVSMAGITLGILFSKAYLVLFSKGLYEPMIQNLNVALRNSIPGYFIIISSFILISLFYFFRRKFSLNYLVVLLVILSTLDVMRFAWKNTPFSEREFLFPKTKTIDYLLNDTDVYRIAGPGIPLNYFMYYKISSAEGYDPIYPLNNGEWFSAVNFGNIENPSRRYGQISNYSSNLINYASVKYIVDYKKDHKGNFDQEGEYNNQLIKPKYTIVDVDESIALFRNEYFKPQVWLSRNVSSVGSQDQIVEEIENDDPQESKLYLINYNDGFDNLDLNYSVDNFQRNNNEISFNVSSDKPAFIFLSESFNSGWRAYINSEETKVYKANLLYQAIKIDKGKFRVVFKFQPKSFRIALTITGLTVLLILLNYIIRIKSANNNKNKVSHR